MINISNMDCLVGLKNIPDSSVDCVITDPPYRIMQRGSQGSMGGFWSNEQTKRGKIFDHNDISCKDYLPELYRVLKDGTLCYIMINNLNLQEMLNEATKVGFHFVKSLIWEKSNKICGRYYMGCYEYILLFRKGPDRPINDCGTPDILKVDLKKLKNDDGTNMHDTEKPVELMEILVGNSTNENEVVLDPFMGIGATGVACKNLNRQFIGFEIDSKYYNVADERINSKGQFKTPCSSLW